MSAAPSRFRSIATLLIQRIMALAVVCLIIHIWLEWRHERERFEHAMHILTEASQRTLSNALWDIEEQAVRQQLQWMAELPEVAHVQVHITATGQVLEAGDAAPSATPDVRRAIMPPDGQNIALGELRLWQDRAHYRSVILNSTARVLLGYVLFTSVICWMVAWVMRRELGRPLAQIAKFARSLQPNELSNRLQLQRPARPQTDEIDLVIEGFQRLQDDLRRYIEHLDQLVADRTEKLEALVEEVKRLSLQDALTGSINRRGMEERMPQEIERSQRYQRPLSVLFADIDHFKSINDQHGHGAGDMVLRDIAGRLQDHLRSQIDWMARYGGEEFLIVMPETSVAEAAELAERLAQQVRAQPVLIQGQPLRVTASFGVAQYHPGERLQDFLERADQMLYQAKAQGRDRVCVAP